MLVEVNGDMAMIAGGRFTIDVPAAGDGPFTAVATARDAAGNSSTASVSVIVDSVPPQISVSSPSQGFITNQSTLQIVGSVSDSAPVTLRLGDVLVPLSNNTFSQAAALAPEGERTLTLRATDAASALAKSSRESGKFSNSLRPSASTAASRMTVLSCERPFLTRSMKSRLMIV